MPFQVLADKKHISICTSSVCEIDRENFNLKINKMIKEAAIEVGEVSKVAGPRRGIKRGLSIMDFILRIVAAIATLGAAVAMGQNEQTLTFSTQFVLFRAEFDDLPTFVFFLLTNSIVCGYLVLSLMLSLFHIVRSNAVKSRILLIFLDTVMLALLTAAASAAAAIVYIAHYGNPNANWFAVCLQFPDYCQQASGTLIGAFGAAVLFIILILISAVAISRH